MKRRRFLGVLLAVFGATAATSFAYPLLRFFAPPSRDSRVKNVSISKNDIPLGGARSIVFNDNPVIVINRYEKGFVAFSRVCTHLGCLVEYDKGQRKLVCPCHAGTFDLDGNVLSGPPPGPLPLIPLKVEGDFIIIGTSVTG
ncbi:MAG: ubiquinol-cytochrome c reductase iron-sulfur subunit [Nitrospirae bacterium]|nr:ubiquinol-cytochrome c reductase iron-sulfur subunit [Nitrospirota bacterium]